LHVMRSSRNSVEIRWGEWSRTFCSSLMRSLHAAHLVHVGDAADSLRRQRQGPDHHSVYPKKCVMTVLAKVR